MQILNRRRRPRLAIVTAAYPPHAGGAERQLAAIAPILSTTGWDVTIIAGVGGGQENVQPIPGVRLQRRVGRAPERPPMAGPRFTALATGELFRLRPDITLASLLGCASISGAIYSKLTSRPLIVRLGGGGIKPGECEVAERSRSRAGRAELALLASCQSRFVVPARHMLAATAASAGIDQTNVVRIANGVSSSLQEIARLVPREGRRRVAWYTNGEQWKQAQLFLEVVDAAPDISFTACGATADLPDRPNLHRVGWRTDLQSVWAECGVVLNTSLTEGSPNFVLQALATGCWAVGVANAGMQEVAEDHPHFVAVVGNDPAKTTPGDLAAGLRAALAEMPLSAAVPSVLTHEDAAGIWNETLESLL